MSDALVAQGLVKYYGKRRVVDDVSVTVSPGEVVGLLGPNGAGKTTTFYLIVGLLRPQAGTIRFGEEDLTDFPVYLRARRGIGYLAQEPSIFRKLTVRENVLAVLETMKISKAEREQRLGGLLDEPFVGIDPIAVAEIQEIVARLRKRGLGILITDHNVRETLRVTNRAYIMYQGRILVEGTSEQLTTDPQARRFYLGEQFSL